MWEGTQNGEVKSRCVDAHFLVLRPVPEAQNIRARAATPG